MKTFERRMGFAALYRFTPTREKDEQKAWMKAQLKHFENLEWPSTPLHYFNSNMLSLNKNITTHYIYMAFAPEGHVSCSLQFKVLDSIHISTWLEDKMRMANMENWL